jgi:hypothetical protein
MTRRGWGVVAISALAVAIILAAELAFDWGGWWDREWLFPDAVRRGNWWAVGPHQAGGLGLHLVRLIGEYLLGVLVLFSAPRMVRRLADAVAPGGRELVRYLVVGLLFTVALVGVAVSSAFSMHTLVMPFLAIGAFFVIGLAGRVGLTFALGRGLLEWGGWRARAPLVSLGLGTLVVYAFTQVPFLGPPVMVGVSAVGVGVVMVRRFGSGQPWTLEPLVEDR